MDERPREPFAMGMPSLAARALIVCALQPIRPAIWPASIPERANCRKVWSSTSLQLICLPKLYLYVSGAISPCGVTTGVIGVGPVQVVYPRDLHRVISVSL